MTPDDPVHPASGEPAQASGVSRRELLTGAGALAASVGLGVAQPAAAAAESDDGRDRVGVAARGVTAGEFRSRIAQSGEIFTSYGYVTKAAGATEEDLFSDTTHNETTALLTVYSEGNLVQRALDQNVHALDVAGVLTIYQRDLSGASFSDPESFKIGKPVAQFTFTLQDILTVFAPGRGLPTLTGDMWQTAAASLSHGKRFGRVGIHSRVFATGLGALNDPATLSATFEMAGNWTVE